MLKTLLYHLRRNWFYDIGGIDRTVLVLGVGRSGTTWLGTVLADALGAREMFEPCLVGHDGRFSTPRLTIAPADRTICENMLDRLDADNWRRLRRVLKGKVRSPWCDRWGQRGLYHGRVVKEVRFSMVAREIASALPVLPVVIIRRRALAVVESMLAINQTIGAGFDLNPVLLAAHDGTPAGELARRILAEDDAPWRRLTVRWALETTGLKTAADLPNVLTVHYEDITDPASPRWNELRAHCRSPRWNNERLAKIFTRPSRVTIPRGEACLTPEQRAWIEQTSAAFGL
jgi:hypothetical protein